MGGGGVGVREEIVLGLTVQMKFEPVFVTVAVAEEEEPLKDFTKSVHIKALKKNTSRKDVTLATTTV